MKTQTGFTLVELAIVLIVVALLLGGMVVSLSAQYDQRNYNDTQKQMSEIVEALTGYAVSHTDNNGNPYLPCPNLTNYDGREERNAGACTSQEGRIPWVDLGIGQQDAWGNHFRYRVAAAYSNSQAGFTLSATSAANTLRICTDSGCASPLANQLPVIIVSHGKNGLGAFNRAGTTNPAPTSADEIENQNGDNNFVSHALSNVAGNEFDDLVVWISPYLLFNRMVTAGKLPASP